VPPAHRDSPTAITSWSSKTIRPLCAHTSGVTGRVRLNHSTRLMSAPRRSGKPVVGVQHREVLLVLGLEQPPFVAAYTSMVR
jgi:hypothetical protein